MKSKLLEASKDFFGTNHKQEGKVKEEEDAEVIQILCKANIRNSREP